jgi:hypothetical protein
MEHRLVYEQFSADDECCILPRVHVHHKNRIRDDNRRENLMLTLPSEHRRYINKILVYFINAVVRMYMESVDGMVNNVYNVEIVMNTGAYEFQSCR